MPKHLHPFTIVVRIVSSLIKTFAFVLLGKTFIFQHISLTILITVVLVIFTAFTVWGYLTETYEIGPDEITHRKGLITKQTVHIPYMRIQSIDRISPWYLQIFGLLKLQIETSGGQEKPLELAFISNQVANEIEAHRNQQHHAMEVATATLATDVPTANENSVVSRVPVNRTTYQISQTDLVLYGLTSLGIFSILIPLSFIGSKWDEYAPKHLQDNANHFFALSPVALVIGLVVLALILSCLISLLQILNKYYHHTVTREHNTLAITHGFTSKIAVHMDTRKIQAVVFEQTVLRRLLGLYTVKLILASDTDQGEDKDGNSGILIPVGRREALLTHLPALLPNYDYDFTSLNQTEHFWQFWRYAMLWLLWTPFIFLAYHNRILFLSLIVLVVAAFIGLTLWAWLAAKDTHVQLMPDQVILQNNSSLTKKTFLIKPQAIQSSELSYSIWMAHGSLRHWRFTLRDANTAREVVVRYQPLTTTNQLESWFIDYHQQLQQS